MSAYKKLEEHFREVANFEHASGILNWDNADMMPSGSADVRATGKALDVNDFKNHLKKRYLG